MWSPSSQFPISPHSTTKGRGSDEGGRVRERAQDYRPRISPIPFSSTSNRRSSRLSKRRSAALIFISIGDTSAISAESGPATSSSEPLSRWARTSPDYVSATASSRWRCTVAATAALAESSGVSELVWPLWLKNNAGRRCGEPLDAKRHNGNRPGHGWLGRAPVLVAHNMGSVPSLAYANANPVTALILLAPVLPAGLGVGPIDLPVDPAAMWLPPPHVIERLAAARADEGLLMRETWLLRLRAMLARAHGDDTAYHDYRDRYHDTARTLGFEGHIAWAETMP
jgi:hypothetical protein